MNFIIFDFSCRIRPDRSVKIIGACVILHNIALSNNIPLPEEIIEDVQNENDGEIINDNNGNIYRDAFVARYF